MTSEMPGTGTSRIEVTNVSCHGFWLWLDGEEAFLPFDRFPWFRDASIREIAAVEWPSPNDLYWPALDVDLAFESVRHPDRYPLVSRAPRAAPAASGRRP